MAPAQLQAKFQCTGVQEFYTPGTASTKSAESVTLTAVYSSDPNDPNHSWSQATPSGQLTMYISNPAAWGFYKGGQEYMLTLVPAAAQMFTYPQGIDQEPVPLGDGG